MSAFSVWRILLMGAIFTSEAARPNHPPRRGSGSAVKSHALLEEGFDPPEESVNNIESEEKKIYVFEKRTDKETAEERSAERTEPEQFIISYGGRTDDVLGVNAGWRQAAVDPPRYRMMTVYEEAFLERHTLCTDALSGAENKAAVKGFLPDIDAKWDTTWVVSIGSSSTQAYTCGKWIAGYFSGAQAETHNPGQVQLLVNKVLKESNGYIILQGSSFSKSPFLASLCDLAGSHCVGSGENRAWEMWSKTTHNTTAEPFVNDPKWSDQAPVVHQYWDAFRSALQTRRELPQLDSVFVLEKNLDNQWVKSLQRAIYGNANAAADESQRGLVLDWGGSGPKQLTGCEAYSFEHKYDNKYLVNGTGPLNATRLCAAIEDVIAKTTACLGYRAKEKGWTRIPPVFIGQTGLAREKWMRGDVQGDCTLIMGDAAYDVHSSKIRWGVLGIR